MFEISFPVKYSEIETVLERLYEIELYSTYYDAPFQVTIDDNGYGFYEKPNEVVSLKVYPECESAEECKDHLQKIKEKLNLGQDIIMQELKDTGWQQPFEPVNLNNGWLIAEPEIEAEGLRKINFVSQGSFGTGLHETTQDMLRCILDSDFTGQSVLDLGTGSGILAIAAALKNADNVVALDIRDVSEEVLYNAALNNLNNIEVVVADVTSKDMGISGEFDAVFINIGGEETLSSMKLINNVLKPGGILFVSGLVEWSSHKFLQQIGSMGYQIVESTKTNEWVTTVLNRA
ncbi:50S ribosomal protein L11 methyltransferase [Clostridium thermarum]|uniref:50S ribosomal protein L11 methyltransferase n=1 Tax=Clostridium thermarum TaxID=1716543 RepID=UPI0013D04A9D|nr:50S ribosomal protein L11 methyltransferase [Clostridium thermarum]